MREFNKTSVFLEINNYVNKKNLFFSNKIRNKAKILAIFKKKLYIR